MCAILQLKMDRFRRRSAMSSNFRSSDGPTSPKEFSQSFCLGAFKWCCLGIVILAGVVIALQIDMGSTLISVAEASNGMSRASLLRRMRPLYPLT